jgi:uncharacterized protein YjbJ (UPF0337 family)
MGSIVAMMKKERMQLPGMAGTSCAACLSRDIRRKSKWRIVMNKDQVKGVAEKVKGKVNDAVGKATDDPAQELKGDLQQEAGQTRKDIGDVKEAAKDVAKDKR